MSQQNSQQLRHQGRLLDRLADQVEEQGLEAARAAMAWKERGVLSQSIDPTIYSALQALQLAEAIRRVRDAGTIVGV